MTTQDPNKPSAFADDDDLGLDLDHRPRPNARLPSTPPPPAFHCPKCGAAQPPSASCTHCGVIFAKLRAPSRAGSLPGATPSTVPPGVPVVRGTLEVPPPRGASLPPGVAPPGLSAPAFEGASATSMGPVRRRVEPLGTSIGYALIVPFLGIGVLWVPIIALTLLGASFTGGRLRLILFAGMMGLVAAYFARSFARGFSAEIKAPDLPKLDDVKRELVYPGLALIGLTAILFALPAYQAYRLTTSVVGSVIEDVSARAEEHAKRQRVEPLPENEVFLDEDGRLVTPKEGDEGRRLKRHDGHWVRVHWEDALIVYEDENAAAGDDARAALGGEDEARAIAARAASKVPVAGALLLVVLMLLPFVYWPGALSVAAASGNALSMFDPTEVFSVMMRAGLAYFVVVAVGMGIVGVTLALMLLGASADRVFLFVELLLGVLAYTSAVQGFLMGRLAARDPQLFPAFEG